MKKIAKLLLTLLGGIILTSNVYAQESSKDVTITASGSGATLEDAKLSALRSATEQAFGAFISSKTEVFNDQVVADQMSSVSSGNIKSYEVLNEDQLPDGRWGTTIKAIVSVDKLTSFVQAKGIEIEIKGGLFALNIKQQLLNEQGEVEAVYAMVGLLHEPMQTAFDYTIKSGDPKSTDAESKNWEIPLIVTATCNKNMDFCANYFIKTLKAISLDSAQVSTYKSLGKQVLPVIVDYNGINTTFYLRKKTSISAIGSLTSNWEFYTRLFAVQSGMDEFSSNGEGKLYEFYRTDRKNGNFSISFLTAGKNAGMFSWNDKRTLSQIEQMTGYTVKPIGVISYFKNGGYLIYEKDGHGLVLSPCDIDRLNWNDAKLACEELVINGYSDWRLPTIDELNQIDVNRDVHMSCGLTEKWFDVDREAFYWSEDKSVYMFKLGYWEMYLDSDKFYNRYEHTLFEGRIYEGGGDNRARSVRTF